jgi:hypothetical protein
LTGRRPAKKPSPNTNVRLSILIDKDVDNPRRPGCRLSWWRRLLRRSASIGVGSRGPLRLVEMFSTVVPADRTPASTIGSCDRRSRIVSAPSTHVRRRSQERIRVRDANGGIGARPIKALRCRRRARNPADRVPLDGSSDRRLCRSAAGATRPWSTKLLSSARSPADFVVVAIAH